MSVTVSQHCGGLLFFQRDNALETHQQNTNDGRKLFILIPRGGDIFLQTCPGVSFPEHFLY